MFFNKSKSKNKDIETLLLTENKRLKIENQQLKETLDELDRYKQEYKQLIETVADLKNDYQTKMKQFDQLENEYRKELNRLLNNKMPKRKK